MLFEPIVLVVVDGERVEEECGDNVAEGGNAKDIGEVDVVAEHASEEHTQSDAYIPCGHVGGGRSATLVVAGEVDKQCVHGGEDETIAQTRKQGGRIEQK